MTGEADTPGTNAAVCAPPRQRLPSDPGDAYIEILALLRYIACRKFAVPRADADALVHDVFATFLANRSAVRDARAYLVAAISNASRQYHRRQQFEEQLFTNDSLGSAQAELDIDRLSHALEAARLLARIGAKCRELLRRYYLYGESTPAIAADLQVTPAYVLQLLHGCRRRARELREERRI